MKYTYPSICEFLVITLGVILIIMMALAVMPIIIFIVVVNVASALLITLINMPIAIVKAICNRHK